MDYRLQVPDYSILYNKFPNLYRDQPIRCGVTFGLGWLSLALDLSENLENDARSFQAGKQKENVGGDGTDEGGWTNHGRAVPDSQTKARLSG